MKSTPAVRRLVLIAACAAAPLATASVTGQLPDRTQAPNAAEAGIALSLADQIGAGRGDWNTIDSSDYIITRDPFRAIRRGRQLFQRKFTHLPRAANAHPTCWLPQGRPSSSQLAPSRRASTSGCGPICHRAPRQACAPPWPTTR